MQLDWIPQQGHSQATFRVSTWALFSSGDLTGAESTSKLLAQDSCWVSARDFS